MKRLVAAALALLFTVAFLMPFPRPTPPPVRRPGGEEPTVTLRRGEARELLKMEEYVAGVVAAEMDPAFPPEALAAQAIVARTYTLRRMAEGTDPTTDVRTFQAYGPGRITDTIRTAVTRTRGLVVLYGNDLAHTVYHACAGGRTAGAREGMQATEEPYLRPVADPPCRRDETWTAQFTAAEVARAAGLKGNLQRIALGDQGASGRTLTIRLNDTAVSAFQLRDRLGDTRLKSTYITKVTLRGGSVRLEGRGYGHGVGLSQWGAAALAEKGYTAEEIIQHYYPGVRLEQRW